MATRNNMKVMSISLNLSCWSFNDISLALPDPTLKNQERVRGHASMTCDIGISIFEVIT